MTTTTRLTTTRIADRRSFLLLPVIGLAVAGLPGCGDSGGVKRYQLSGSVTFAGKPVPKGYLRFAPDKEQGNSGPGANATIIDGKYETLPNNGTVGGPHIVRVVGTDGVPYKTNEGMTVPIGRPLFDEHEFRVDLPRESASYDFEVPGG